jgi:hypothetical protein
MALILLFSSKKRMKQLSVTFLLFSIFILLFSSCTKNESSAVNDSARLQVYLTDDPGDYEAVLIDIQDVQINYSSDASRGWSSLNNVSRGTYNILDLINDKDTILADAEIKTGRVQQIRLVLGPNNFVRIDNQNYPLQTPSAQQSGLKINIKQDIQEGILYKILLDFDAARSVVKRGNNSYSLKPVIRATLQATGGSIKGYVLPNNIQTSVFAIQGMDTVAGTITSNGNYVIKSLNAGSYNLSFVPSDTPVHQIQNIPGIVVNNNAVTVVDTVRLQ